MFNFGNFLYAYIELFSTFQVYVLLSDNYEGEVYKEYCQIVNRNDGEENKDEIMDSLRIYDFKDAYIIASQYGIDIKKVAESLEEKQEYDDGEDGNGLFEEIQRIAYERIRKKSYERPYSEMLSEKYDSIDFNKVLQAINEEDKIQFYSEFQYYTCYDLDTIDIEKYKLLLKSNGQEYLYPEVIIRNMNNKECISSYGYYKFYMLMSYLQYN